MRGRREPKELFKLRCKRFVMNIADIARRRGVFARGYMPELVLRNNGELSEKLAWNILHNFPSLNEL